MRLSESFQNPSSEFRQAPFWFWNHRLDKETLDWQMDMMQSKGIGGFVMHARHGLITPYLSEEWFDCIRFCCQKARERGMMAWAYDERDWPSGPAAGETLKDPANRMSYVRFDIESVEGPATITFSPEVQAAYVAENDVFKRIEGTTWSAPAGTSRIARLIRFECPSMLWFESYLDTLSQKACDAFIASTYDKHEAVLGDLKAMGLEGFFTDEPALSTYPDDLRRIPWTPELVDAFKARKGYDLLDFIPDLFGVTERGKQVRCDYWDLATSLFENAFFKTIHDWCEKRGLKMIGHPLGEEPLFFQFRCLGTIFPYLKHFHMPGLDHLAIQVGKGQASTLSPKMVESAALLAGRERTMTETFGESGWGLTLREMKWMADWQMAHGINYIIPHAFYYSVAGRRKKDSPPSEFFQSPFWPYYQYFADYTARITAAMTGGEHVARIAVLYPMSSVWAEFVPGETVSPVVQELETAFWPLGAALLNLHRDFIVLDEASFAKAQVNGKTFTVNGLEFDAVVIPKITVIREDALATLKQIAATGTAVAVSSAPVKILSVNGPEPGAELDLTSLGITLTEGASASALERALAPVPADVQLTNADDVFYLHRRKEGKDLYFLANTAHEPVKTIASLASVGYAECWDPATGNRTEIPGQHVQEGRLVFPLELASVGSALIVVDPAREPGQTPLVLMEPAKRIVFDDRWHFNPENGNFIALRNWTLATRTRGHVTELRYTAQLSTTEFFANMRLIVDGIPKQPHGVSDAVLPMMGFETRAAVYWDGTLLEDELPWEFDPQFRVLAVPHRTPPGRHTIELVIQNNGWFPQPGLEEYVWLAGDFHVEHEGTHPYLVPLRGINIGPWEEQGYPCFSGTGAYFADITLPKEVLNKRLFLNAGRVGDLLEVEINGQHAGVYPWPPYRAEVSNLFCEGPNLVVLKVTNSARNFFEGPDKANPSGLLDRVVLEVF